MTKFIVEGGTPLNGTITPSGNKNEALPALMATILCKEKVILKRMPRIRDILTTCDILTHMGAEINWVDDETLEVDCKNLSYQTPLRDLCAKIRASILLIGPLLARFGQVELPLPGGDVIGARRIDPHFHGLRALGAQIELGSVIEGSMVSGKGAYIFLDEPSVTATENILLLAVLTQGKTTIYNAASEPHVSGLCNMLNTLGGKITGIGTNRLEIEGVEKLHGGTHKIGADFMEVGSFICLGAITEGSIIIKDADVQHMEFICRTLARIGVESTFHGNDIHVTKSHLKIQQDIGGKTPSIYSSPWPAFPTDLMSIAIVAATQTTGTVIFHEKMFEGRMFFTDKLQSMGANTVLCDPHRVVINGPAPLRATNMSSPDVRAGMAMLMAAVIAQGTSEIHNIYQIERGYYNIEKKLASLGAKITRVEQPN